MSDSAWSAQANHVLRALRPDDLEHLRPHLDTMKVELGDILGRPGQPIERVFFPLSGAASITRPTPPGHLEVGLIGRDGLVGAAAILQAESSPNQVMVQMPGTFLHIAADLLMDAAHRRPTLHRVLLRYVQVLLVQTESTAMAYSLLNIESRLARWILMFHDRSEGDQIRITHDFLSMMLGVRRPGVTGAIHLLEGNGLIRSTRGMIAVRDRAKLEALVSDAYGTAEREHERLVGTPLRRAQPTSHAPAKAAELVAP